MSAQSAPFCFGTNTWTSLDKSLGIISSQYLKDPSDSQWQSDAALETWRAFMRKYAPEGDLLDSANVYAYAVAQTMVHVLKACGGNLTRENAMKQAASIRDLHIDTLLPGIRINTSASDYAPIEAVQMARFDGKTWLRFGEVMKADGK